MRNSLLDSTTKAAGSICYRCGYVFESAGRALSCWENQITEDMLKQDK